MNAYNAGDFDGQWDYSQLPNNIVVGHGCYLEDRKSFERIRSTRDTALVLGAGAKVFGRTVFSIESNGFVSIGIESTLVGAIFECAERILVGDHVTISYNVIIADCDFHPKDPLLRHQDAIAIAPQGDSTARPPFFTRAVQIDDDVHVGIGAFILKGIHVGAGARIGPGAVVTSDVPPGAFVSGNPARVVSIVSEERT